MFQTRIFFPGPLSLWNWEFVTTCDGAVPTTACEGVVPTATTEDVRPKEMGRYRKSYELGGQARVIGRPMGVGKLIQNRGVWALGLKPPTAH
jgi:hypothetical protein